MMKIKISAILIACICEIIVGCKKDNYDPPKSILQGAITYQGDSIGVSYNDVTFQLWQQGFGKLTPINVTVDQDGSFSALLFDGEYKAIIQSGQGPFISLINTKTNSDTIPVTVKGNSTFNIEVLPYYMIDTYQFSQDNGTVDAEFSIKKVITDTRAKDIESVSLYIGKTKFLDKRTSISTVSLKGNDITDMNAVSLSAKIPEMTPTQNYVFVRIGLKIKSTEDMIFSPIKELDF